MNKKLLALISGFIFTLSCSTPTNTNSQSPTPTISSKPQTNDTGFVEGKFTVSNLCPVEPCAISEQDRQNAYNIRKIQILTSDGKTLIKEVSADYSTKSYKAELPVGVYLVNVANASKKGTFQPKELIISSGKTTTLNLDIDAGNLS